MVGLFRWLVDLRDRVAAEGAGVLRAKLCLTLNKGKPSREHSYPHIKQAVSSLLQGAKCPVR